MRRTPAGVGALALAAVVLACSRGADAGSADAMAPVFGGFRLLRPQDEVMAEARRGGMELECMPHPGFDQFCSNGPLSPEEVPARWFGFRGGVLVSLGRSTHGEGGASADTLAAAFRRAFGAPALEGEPRPGVHARTWIGRDSTVLGVLSCSRPAERGCTLGLDYVPDADVARMIADWRAMIRRTAAGKAGARPGEPSGSGAMK